MDVDRNIIETFPGPVGGIQMGWARLASYFLDRAEQKYGPQNHFCFKDGRLYRLVFTGIEFEAGNPGIIYPASENVWEGHVGIKLSTSCATNYWTAFYQLAQECAHLLSPTGGSDATVLEVGMSVVFAESQLTECHQPIPFCPPTYVKAGNLTHDLLAINPDAIKLLRQCQPWFHLMTSHLILQLFPSFPLATAGTLVRRFDGWVP